MINGRIKTAICSKCFLSCVTSGSTEWLLRLSTFADASAVANVLLQAFHTITSLLSPAPLVKSLQHFTVLLGSTAFVRP